MDENVKNEVTEKFDAIQKGLETSVNDVQDKLSKKIEDSAKEAEGRFDVLEGKIETMNITATPGFENDPKGGYDSHVDFLKDVVLAECAIASGKGENSMPERLKRYASVGSDEAATFSKPGGGFLIPSGIAPGIMSTDPQAIQSDMGTLTTRIPMGVDSISINARVDKNHTSSVTGGFQLYRRAEAAAVEATKAEFEQIELRANSLSGLSYATEELITRSPESFSAIISSGFNDEFRSKLNGERLRGTGAGEYMGILNSPALVTVDKKGSQAGDTIVGENIIKMRARIWGYQNAIWMVNQDVYNALTTAHITGTNGDVFLFAPGNGIDVPDTILGRPVVFDENMSTLGDLGDIALVNWSEYLEGQLGGATFAESIHVRFIYNERTFKFNVYNDGQPWWRTPLTPKNSTETLSPFVTLAERS